MAFWICFTMPILRWEGVLWRLPPFENYQSEYFVRQPTRTSTVLSSRGNSQKRQRHIIDTMVCIGLPHGRGVIKVRGDDFIYFDVIQRGRASRGIETRSKGVSFIGIATNTGLYRIIICRGRLLVAFALPTAQLGNRSNVIFKIL